MEKTVLKLNSYCKSIQEGIGEETSQPNQETGRISIRNSHPMNRKYVGRNYV
jgi:hypothetical protein